MTATATTKRPRRRTGATADFTLVTCRDLRGLSVDDELLAAALRRRGHVVRTEIWTDAGVDWSSSPVTVIRSTWDYFRVPATFLDWLARTERHTTLVNDAAAIRWNHHKRYLTDLSAAGIPIVPTMFVEPGENIDAKAIADLLAADAVVLKPTIAGAAWGARRFARSEFGKADVHLAALVAQGTAMAQPFMPAVMSERERSVVLFDGKPSHAFSKPPFSPGALGGAAGEAVHEPSPAELDLAIAACRAAGFDTAYARADMVPTPDGPVLMELELIEPALKFGLAPGSADRLATVLERRVETAGASLLRGKDG